LRYFAISFHGGQKMLFPSPLKTMMRQLHLTREFPACPTAADLPWSEDEKWRESR
jgi:hypothetical protein